jgi:hypothetical protein
LALFDLAALESASPRSAVIVIGAAPAPLAQIPALYESIFLASIAVTVQNLKYLTNGP